MEFKICKQCGIKKPLCEFYEHKKMLDGHLNKCKDCIKENTHKLYENKIKDPIFVENERKRGRSKYRRLYAGKKGNTHSHKENSYTRKSLKDKGVNVEGLEVHHWNYNRRMDVFLLSPRGHKLAHRNIVFDKESNMFRYKGVLLDTAEKHRKVLEELFDTKEYEIRYCNLS